jgi:hypothetical protein
MRLLMTDRQKGRKTGTTDKGNLEIYFTSKVALRTAGNRHDNPRQPDYDPHALHLQYSAVWSPNAY